MDTITSDLPKIDPNEDRFNRWLFAQRIANTIMERTDNSSIVIGIYGSWGDGKTTVLNFIEHELKHQSNAIICRYNPWRFPDEEKLLLSFYHNLADAIGQSEITNKEKIGKWINKYITPFGAVVGHGETVKEFSILLSSVSIEKIKERINEILDKAGKRVCVLIDDIDRLDKDEIQALFRLVKLNADFHYTTYILAFDEEMVASALQEKYISIGKESGRSFIEKIIQVPLNLPAVPKISLRHFCFSRIDEAIKGANIDMSEDEIQRFVRIYTDGIENRMLTPRLATRYANILSFSLPILKDEINPVDLMLFEGIKLFYPNLYKTITLFPDIFLRPDESLQLDSTRERERAKIRDLIDSALPNFTDVDLKAAKNLLISLFPRLEEVYSNTSYGNDWEVVWAKGKRIASRDYFPRYISYSINDQDVSDNALDTFVESLGNISVEEGIYAFKELISKNNVEMVISKLRRRSDEIESEDSIKLSIIIAISGKLFPETEALFSFTGPFSQAAMLISNLVENINEKEKRLNIIKEVINIAEPINFCLEITTWLKYEREDKEQWVFTKEEEEIIRTLAADRVRALLSNDNVFILFPDNSVRLLLNWARWGTTKDQDKYIKNLLKSDLSQVHILLNSLVPISHELGTGKRSKSDFDQNCYDALKKIISPNYIYKVLAKIYKDQLITDHYPNDFEIGDVNLRIAKQFWWLYRKNELEPGVEIHEAK